MLKTLKQIAVTGIVTEAPPAADEGLRVREALERRIREVLGRALCIRAGRRRLVQRLRARDPRA